MLVPFAFFWTDEFTQRIGYNYYKSTPMCFLSRQEWGIFGTSLLHKPLFPLMREKVWLLREGRIGSQRLNIPVWPAWGALLEADLSQYGGRGRVHQLEFHGMVYSTLERVLAILQSHSSGLPIHAKWCLAALMWWVSGVIRRDLRVCFTEAKSTLSHWGSSVGAVLFLRQEMPYILNIKRKNMMHEHVGISLVLLFHGFKIPDPKLWTSFDICSAHLSQFPFPDFFLFFFFYLIWMKQVMT